VRGGPFETMHLRIFNGWGEIIFETTDPEFGWDGTHDGKPEINGVYVYTVVATSTDGREHDRSGKVTLMRWPKAVQQDEKQTEGNVDRFGNGHGDRDERPGRPAIAIRCGPHAAQPGIDRNVRAGRLPHVEQCAKPVEQPLEQFPHHQLRLRYRHAGQVWLRHLP